MRKGLFAIINVGASAIRMHISQFVDGEERIIEYNIKLLRLGRDTFTKGYITLENVYRATEILEKFSQKLDEYGIRKSYKAICTSGIREARNKNFFVDHVRNNTGVNLEVIDATEEIYIKYLGLKNDFPGFDQFEQEGVMFANISSGNVAINVLKDKHQVFSASLPYGSLRLREMLRNIPREKRYRAYEQYSNKMIFTIKSSLPAQFEVKHLLCSGSSIDLILKMFENSTNFIALADVESLYDGVKLLPVDQIMKNYGIDKNEAIVLLPTLSTYLHLMRYSGTKGFYFSKQSFPHQLACFYMGINKDRFFVRKVRNTFYNFGSRFMYDEKHARQVARFALKVFDRMQHIHSLGSKERYILESAAILHDVGYYMGYDEHHQHSFNIINAMNIPGVDHETIRLIGFIALLHRGQTEELLMRYGADIGQKKQLLIKKLVTLLRVADSLDTSHMQLIKDFDIKIEAHRLIIAASATKSPFVEMNFFEASNAEFVETYGIPVKLEVKIDHE